jgi:acetoin utilization protein AcuB
MKVRDWMTVDPVTVSPDTTVAEARSVMEADGFRHLPVVAGGRLIGIVSDRDVAIKEPALRAAVRQHNVEDLLDDDRPVESVMSAGPHVIGQDAAISEATRLLVSRRISALPVVDDDRTMVGIITSVDCLLAALENADDV